MKTDKANNYKYLALVVGGILVNILGGFIAKAFSLPIYLDCIGTMIAAISGGYLPGILVGFFSNLISGFKDYSNTYYSIISVLIAIAATYLNSKGYFKKTGKIAVSVLVFTLIGGGIGSVITWGIYGNTIGEEISASLANRLYASYIPFPYLAELAADLIYDLPDKLISTLTALLAVKLIPSRLLPGKARSGNDIKNFKGLSLGTKLILLVSVAVILVTAAVSFVSYGQFEESVISRESDYALSVAEYVGSLVDPDKVDDYISEGEAAEGYTETEEKLDAIWGSSDRIEYLYVYRIEEDGCHVVFDVDTDETEGGSPGEVIAFDESFAEYIPSLLNGEPIDPLITNDTYGWLLTAYSPVYDPEGNCTCYAAVDVAMTDLVVSEQIFAAKTISMLLGFFTVILSVGVTLANYCIVTPVNSLAEATEDFAYNDDEARNETVERLKALGIRTGDEIENLYHALTKTTQDTVDYITETQRQSTQLEMLQSAMINVMANLVESRDTSTGMHIKNTAEYVRIIVEQLKKDGVYEDILTPEYMVDVVASAPLHDVGKIMVSDTILNKPGKLTDEEFEKMKIHTIEGAKIIDDVINQVGEVRSGYLYEARNMAHYHHEKWNGKGYPEGLSGEDIPLSARIMAVADVFDALVSSRCYKPAFSFEQAMDIIQKDSGTHFDPQVVKAFVEAEDRVRQVTADIH
ncbi:MAG: HD domain-containing protein [Clostridiales bacterium]|nr:HD domain-containing protein [Clostridiales bacterium]